MGRLLRPSPASLAYAAVVGVLAGAGFAGAAPWAIVVAAALALPASLAAVPAYYLAYGVLATVLGAVPGRSTGSGSMSPDGRVAAAGSGDPAAWFTLTADVLGVVALVLAAVVNVLLLRLAVRRTSSAGAAAEPGS